MSFGQGIGIKLLLVIQMSHFDLVLQLKIISLLHSLICIGHNRNKSGNVWVQCNILKINFNWWMYDSYNMNYGLLIDGIFKDPWTYQC